MVLSVLNKDKNQRSIRMDGLMDNIHLSLNDLDIVDTQICSYSLYILIKNSLDDFKNNKIDWHSLLKNVLKNQQEFIDELAKKNMSHKAITSDRYTKFINSFYDGFRERNSKTLTEFLSNLFYECMAEQEISSLSYDDDIPGDLSEKNLKKYVNMLHEKDEIRTEIIEKIMEKLGGTSVMVNDVLTPYVTEGKLNMKLPLKCE